MPRKRNTKPRYTQEEADDIINTRQCIECKEEFPYDTDHFNRSGPGLSRICRNCHEKAPPKPKRQSQTTILLGHGMSINEMKTAMAEMANTMADHMDRSVQMMKELDTAVKEVKEFRNEMKRTMHDMHEMMETLYNMGLQMKEDRKINDDAMKINLAAIQKTNVEQSERFVEMVKEINNIKKDQSKIFDTISRPASPRTKAKMKEQEEAEDQANYESGMSSDAKDLESRAYRRVLAEDMPQMTSEMIRKKLDSIKSVIAQYRKALLTERDPSKINALNAKIKLKEAEREELNTVKKKRNSP